MKKQSAAITQPAKEAAPVKKQQIAITQPEKQAASMNCSLAAICLIGSRSCPTRSPAAPSRSLTAAGAQRRAPP